MKSRKPGEKNQIENQNENLNDLIEDGAEG